MVYFKGRYSSKQFMRPTNHRWIKDLDAVQWVMLQSKFQVYMWKIWNRDLTWPEGSFRSHEWNRWMYMNVSLLSFSLYFYFWYCTNVLYLFVYRRLFIVSCTTPCPTKADKGKTIVVLTTEDYTQQVNNFIQENQFVLIIIPCKTTKRL
jgi:hypothetical protein